MKIKYKLIILVFVIILTIIPTAVGLAAAWLLDTSFDTDGKVTTDIGTSSTDALGDGALQADMKPIVAGTSDNDFAVVRYNTDGSLDTTFDTDGKVTTDIGTSSADTGNSIVIDGSGKIVVAGTSDNDFAVVRYNTDGSLDTTFDTDGKVTTDIGTGSTDVGNAAILDSSGKIVVVGTSGNSIAVVRYNPNGSLDTTFDTDGKLIFTISGTDTGVDIASSGTKLVVVGTSGSDIGVAVILDTGAFDTTFSTDGKTTVNICATDFGTGVLIQSDGKIIISGYGGGSGTVSCAGLSSGDLTLGRLNEDGSLDTNFASPNGVVSRTFGGADYSNDLISDSTGRILVVGGRAGDYGLQRWNTDGTPDNTFDGDGKILVDVNGTDEGMAGIYFSDYLFYVAGSSGGDFSIVRFADSVPPPPEEVETATIATIIDTSIQYNFNLTGGTFSYGDKVVANLPENLLGEDFDYSSCWISLDMSNESNVAFGFESAEPVFDIHISCAEVSYTEFEQPLTVCLKPNDGSPGDKQMWHKHQGNVFEALSKVAGRSGWVCSTVSKLSLFTLGDLALPETGFTQGVVSSVPSAPVNALNYAGDIVLDIPQLGLTAEIAGVPQAPGGWDVSWLGQQVGYLYGTAFPTWTGNTVLTGHVWDADNTPGIFYGLDELQHGDQFYIHAWGLTYSYEVRNNYQTYANNLSPLESSDYDLVTLLTCESFSEWSGEYRYRRAIQAVLISVD